jgi:hypothetical protein
MKICWRDVQIFNNDGGTPDEETRIEKLREYRDTGGMTGYFLVDSGMEIIENGTEATGRVFDKFHNEERDIWNAGPNRDEIDWTGFPEEV